MTGADCLFLDLLVKFQISLQQSSSDFSAFHSSSVVALSTPATQNPISPGLLPTSTAGTIIEEVFSRLFTTSRTVWPVPVPTLYALNGSLIFPFAPAARAA